MEQNCRLPTQPPSLSRNSSGASATCRRSAFPIIRKTSSNSTLVPVPRPLRIFKRSNRKPSLDSVLRHPSLQSLRPQPSLANIAEPPSSTTAIQRPFVSLDCQVSHDGLLDGDDCPTIRVKKRLDGGRSQQFLDTILRHPSLQSIPPQPPLPKFDKAQTRSLKRNYETLVQTVTTAPYSSPTSPQLDDNTSISHLLSQCPSDRDSATSFTTTTPLPTPSTTTPTNHPSSCALCHTPLPTPLKTYTFPQTAPAIITTILTLHPTIASPPTPSPPSPTPPNPLPTPPPSPPRPPPPWPHPPRSPLFCLPCFATLHALHLCWTCGLSIPRDEERISCGWAWWHWGCVACLLCRAPVKPPEWTGRRIVLREGGMVCGVCRGEVGDVVRLGKGKEREKEMEGAREEAQREQVLWPEVGVGLGGVGKGRDSKALRNLRKISGNWRDVGGHRDRTSGGLRVVGGGGGSGMESPRGRKSAVGTGGRWGGGHGRAGGNMRAGTGKWSRSGNWNGNVNADSIGNSNRNGLGLTYPPLPKWMDKLPGRRGGRFAAVAVGGGGGDDGGYGDVVQRN